MNGYELLIPILLPITGGALIWLLPFMKERRKRNIYIGIILTISAVISVIILWTTKEPLILWQMTEGTAVSFKVDGITRLFGTLMSIVWMLVGFFAFEYMKHEKSEVRFFAFYLIVMGVLNGLFMSANLITMYLFYEMMTLTSLPLVLHNMSKEAIDAGKKYLFYSIAGAFLSLISIFFIYQNSISFDFIPGGNLDMTKLAGNENLMLAFVFLSIIGFGCKAGLFPLHGWLPTAHPVAPAPASAVLSGIITKAGVVVIIRIVFYSIGADFIRGTWVQYTWMILALITIFLGSMMAYSEKILKKRLAYSTVSQVSYILFGLSLLNATGMLGSLLHVIFHSAVKNALFLVAGVIIFKTGCTTVDELKGIGKKMPITIWCFTLVSITLVGIPPTSGFISKWYLATGALEGGIGAFSWIGPAVLLISALLTAGYLLPITVNGFFPGADFDYNNLKKCEPGKLMLVPILILTITAVVLGMFPEKLIEGIKMITDSIGLI